MIVAALDSVWVVLAGLLVIAAVAYMLSTRITPANPKPTPHLPIWLTIKVQGGPDHGHSQQEPMPQDLESFFGMLRSMTKFKAIQSHVSFVLEPEPVVTVTRDAKHLERFKPDPVPQAPSRHMPPRGSMEELGE